MYLDSDLNSTTKKMYKPSSNFVVIKFPLVIFLSIKKWAWKFMLEIDPKHLRVTFCLISFDSCGGSSKCYVSQYRIRILCHKGSCITYIVNFSKATFCNVHFHKVNVHFCGFFSTCYLSHLKLNQVIVPKPIVSYCSALE